MIVTKNGIVMNVNSIESIFRMIKTVSEYPNGKYFNEDMRAEMLGSLYKVYQYSLDHREEVDCFGLNVDFRLDENVVNFV